MLKKTISILFILMLVAPAGLWLLAESLPGVRRELPSTVFPQPDGHAVFQNDYYRALDQYLNEHFVFRERVVLLKNWVDLKLLRKTEHTDIHVGRDGWLFRRSDVGNPMPDGVPDIGAINRMLLELHALEKIITASGRHFRFMVVPSKASIYPEYLGWTPLPSHGQGAFDLFREAQRHFPLKSLVPLEVPLFAGKYGPHLLYDPAASTWNGHGAAVAADALHRSLYKTEIATPVVPATDPHDDLERQALGLSTPASVAMVRHLKGFHADGLGRSVIYGDTGIERLLPHLLPMVQGLDVIETGNIPSGRFEEDLRAYDSLLIQTTASTLRDLSIDLEKVYDQLMNDAAPVTYRAVDLSSVRPMTNTALHPGATGLEVKSLGAHSTFAIVNLPGSYRRCFRVLRLSLSALQPDTMTVTYRMNPAIQMEKTLRPDRFDLYLPLPIKSSVSLRFQPGAQAGLLVLHEAEIIGFPSGDPDACGWSDIVVLDIAKLSRPDAPTAGTRQAERRTVTADPEPIGRAGEEIIRPDDTQRTIPRENRGGLEAGQEKPEIVASITESPANVSTAGETRSVPSSPAPSHPAPDTVSSEQISPGGGETAEKAAPITPALAVKTPQAEKMAQPVRAAPAKPTITLNDFAEGRIFQRQNQQADIVVSGVYTGPIAGIEARVVRHGGVEVVVPWTVIDAAPGRGIFLGLLPGVPEGGWYALEVRAINDHTVLSKGRNRWGVGILMACIGQSNMKEWFFTGTDLEAHPLLRRYTDDGWQALDGLGNGAIAFGNRVITRTGVPVGLIEYAVNGSGLHRKADWGTGYWEDTRPDSIYRRFRDGVAVTGGRLEFVLWIQGEADAARGTVKAEDYQGALTRFVTRQVRRDIINGSTQPNLPFLVVGMVKRPGGRDAPHQAIREAQQAVAEQVAQCYLAATTLDLKNLGKQHLTPEAYTTMGTRVAQTVLYILGRETFYRGPQVAAVRPNDERVLEVSLRHQGGTDVLPATGITGWEVIDADGAVPIQNVFRHDSRTIRIRLARALQERAEVRYLYGAMPDVRRVLRDNASPGLPLEAFRGGLASPSAPPLENPPEATTP